MIILVALGLISVFDIYLMTRYGQRVISVTLRRWFGAISLVVVLTLVTGWLADVRGLSFSDASQWWFAGWALILGIQGAMNLRQARKASAHIGE